MRIIYRQGDLLVSGLKYIAHGCNAQRKMGSGIAQAIRQQYPEAYEAYMQGDMTLGNVIVAETDGVTIFNCITQQYYGRNKNVRYVSYEAIAECIKKIDSMFAVWNNVCEVGFPKIGAGLANGDWEVIEKIIETEAKHFQPVVYTLGE